MKKFNQVSIKPDVKQLKRLKALVDCFDKIQNIVVTTGYDDLDKLVNNFKEIDALIMNFGKDWGL